ncbi:MAG TPA: helix-turn-helix transcriptional regulator [Candidatus Saccharibacteria bacterium]|nr:helix-turn-helix transcriptional regulator [Candidatus Saccharibacteria bacterium]
MSDELQYHIGHKLNQARREKDMTQAEVAKHASTSVNHYAKIERGEVTPSLKMLEKVVNALDIKSSDVLPF